MSVVVPIVVCPCTTIETPGIGSPVSALVTVPEICICADAVKPTNSKNVRIKVSFLIELVFKLHQIDFGFVRHNICLGTRKTKQKNTQKISFREIILKILL